MGLQLATGHHPLCGHFRDDVWRLGATPVCAGCAVLWPCVVLGVALAAALLRMGAGPLPLLVASLAAGLPQATTYLRRWPPAVRVAVKAVGGVGLGVLAVAFLRLPMPLAWRVAALAALLAATLAGLALRMRAIRQTCRRCPWRADWDRCPGFTGPPSRLRPGLDAGAPMPTDGASAPVPSVRPPTDAGTFLQDDRR